MGSERRRDLRAQVDDLPDDVRRRVVLTGYVTDEQKRSLLAGATTLAYPSLYEGSGSRCSRVRAGVPVLTSTAASLPEVAGDGRSRSSPTTWGIEDGLARLFRDAELRERLISAGRARLPMFTWEGSAAATAEVLAGQRDGRRGLDRLVAPMRTPLHQRALPWPRSSVSHWSRSRAAPARPSRGLRLAHPVGEPERGHQREPGRVRRAGDDDPDQARRVPDQGEPELRSPPSGRSRADGVTAGMAFGQPRALTRGTEGRLPGDLPHCYSCALAAWNQGEMDGSCRGARPWSAAAPRRSNPNYWHWARQNVLFDNFFASAGDRRSRTTCSRSPRPPAAPTTTWQDARARLADPAAAPPLQTVDVYDSEGRLPGRSSCFDFLTEGDLLNRARIPWAGLRGERG